MAVPSKRRARMIGFGAVLGGIGLSAALVWQASYSAFSATTANPTNNWTAGSVALSDDDSDAAMFTTSPNGGNAGNLKPGQSGSHCIAVTSTGTLPSKVSLYGTGETNTKVLDTYLTLTITQGTGGGFGSCTNFSPLASGAQVYTGTLANFGTSKSTYANSDTGWAPAGTASETRVFKFDYTLSGSTPNTSQGGTAAIGFTWEAQNS